MRFTGCHAKQSWKQMGHARYLHLALSDTTTYTRMYVYVMSHYRSFKLFRRLLRHCTSSTNSIVTSNSVVAHITNIQAHHDATTHAIRIRHHPIATGQLKSVCMITHVCMCLPIAYLHHAPVSEVALFCLLPHERCFGLAHTVVVSFQINVAQS